MSLTWVRARPQQHLTSPAKSPPERDRPPAPAPPPPPGWRQWLLPVGLALSLWLLFGPGLMRAEIEEIEYSAFLERVDDGQVERVSITPEGQIDGESRDGEAFTTQLPVALGDTDLQARLEDNDVAIEARGTQTSLLDVIIAFAPFLLLVGVFIYLGRRAQGQLAGIGAFGRSQARVFDAERPGTRFDDVAGYQGVKREITEVVDFLRSPDRYRRAGATGPRGVLMVGPPGTGKTLIARAVAGEAEVPFFSVTGSSFVELFVGVGASRVRDLFNQARKRAPAIVFIDEIDAIGQRRGGALISNDEREQTLNQLLAEMDGFQAAEGVVVLAATNRPETLDPALLRPGRFDRQVVVPLPTRAERAGILGVHARGKRLADRVDLDVVARGTPGFSGADLANLVNEAAINAVRDGREVLEPEDFAAARDRIILGSRESSNVLLPDERRAVAVHESGHALVAALSDQADPVERVTILPAGQALGVTQQLPVDDRHLYGEHYMRISLAVRLGGRAAELLVLGEGSTGAANDLAGATDLATRMVREFGLSPRLGPVGYASSSPMYLGSEQVRTRVYAEQTQRIVDEEVSRLLREAEEQATDLLQRNRGALDRLADLLLERETVEGPDVYVLVGRPYPTPREEPPQIVAPIGSGAAAATPTHLTDRDPP